MAKSRSQLLTRVMTYSARGLTAIAVIAIAFFVVQVLVLTKPEVAREDDADSARRVEAMQAAYADVRRSWEGFGTAAAMDSANITAEVTGLVVEVPALIREGQPVTRDQIIARIDPADYEDVATEARLQIENLRSQIASLEVEETRLEEQVDLAEQELQVVRDEFARLQEAFDANAVKPLELDRKRREVRGQERVVSQLRQQLELVEPRRNQLEIQVQSQQERLASAERNVTRSVIRSPLDGIIQELDVEEGERVGPGSPIARVVSLDRIEIPLRFPVSSRGAVGIGSPVLLESRGAKREAWQAPIVRVLPESDPNSRTFLAYVELDEAEYPGELPTPGQFMSATVESETAERRLVVPRRAVLNRAVYIAETPAEALDGTKEANGEPQDVRQVTRRPVDVEFYVRASFDALSPEDEEWAVVSRSAEVSAGEIVILTNLDELKPGMLVVPALVTERFALGVRP